MHTRITPSNILRFKLGAGRYSYKIQLPMGTKMDVAINPPEYLNAEQNEKILDSYSDIWQLGIIVY